MRKVPRWRLRSLLLADTVYNAVHGCVCTVCKLSTLFYRRQGSVDKTSCILCSFCALCCKVSNFVSNNCESLAGFTRSGCFNRSVKRKNVGLECNVFDSLDYVLDGSRFLSATWLEPDWILPTLFFTAVIAELRAEDIVLREEPIVTKSPL